LFNISAIFGPIPSTIFKSFSFIVFPSISLASALLNWGLVSDGAGVGFAL